MVLPPAAGVVAAPGVAAGLAVPFTARVGAGGGLATAAALVAARVVARGLPTATTVPLGAGPELVPPPPHPTSSTARAAAGNQQTKAHQRDLCIVDPFSRDRPE